MKPASKRVGNFRFSSLRLAPTRLVRGAAGDMMTNAGRLTATPGMRPARTSGAQRTPERRTETLTGRDVNGRALPRVWPGCRLPPPEPGDEPVGRLARSAIDVAADSRDARRYAEPGAVGRRNGHLSPRSRQVAR